MARFEILLWLYGPEKFPGLSRNRPQNQFGQFQCRKNLRLNCVEKPPPKKSIESLPNKILGTRDVGILNGTPLKGQNYAHA